MSKVNGHDPGDFKGRPDYIPSDRGSGRGGDDKSGCLSVIVIGLAAITSVAAFVASVWPS